MAITISPLSLVLDTQNPRFVILTNRDQAEIRKYLLIYEDVCQLTSAINDYGSLLPGERIVVLQENNQYVVIEGNRRTCSLQLLLSRDLIPAGFTHRIPPTSQKIIENCQAIEVDVLPNRNAALELMTKRHIEGVKQWKPLAKKQFFAANFNDGKGQSIQNLSIITGVREGEIKEGIRDYKFFFSAYERYSATHPDFNREIISLKIDPFWRIFKARFEYPDGNRVSPTGFLKITYDENFNTISELDPHLFDQIVQLVFEKAIVQEEVNTRNVLTDVSSILPLLQTIVDSANEEMPSIGEASPSERDNGSTENGTQRTSQSFDKNHVETTSTSGSSETPQGEPESGGPQPGGPPPRSFFETISWQNKLVSSNQQHQGLHSAIYELYNLSIYPLQTVEDKKLTRHFLLPQG